MHFWECIRVIFLILPQVPPLSCMERRPLELAVYMHIFAKSIKDTHMEDLYIHIHILTLKSINMNIRRSHEPTSNYYKLEHLSKYNCLNTSPPTLIIREGYLLLELACHCHLIY